MTFRWGSPLAPFLALMLCVSVASAQQATLFPVLRGAISARSAALGGATVALTEDPATVVLNPAVLPTVTDRRVTATFLKHVADINSGMASYQGDIEGTGSFAVTAMFTSYGSFDRADRFGTTTGSFSASDVVFGVSFAREIDTLITWGVTAKYMQSSLDDMAASAIAFDAGVMFRLPQSRTNIGFSILNLGTQLATYDGTKDRLPVDVRLGVNHRLRGLPLLVNASLNHLADDVARFTDRFLNFSVGGEFYVGKYVRLRLGYDNSTRNLSGVNVATQLTGVSGGLGVRLATFDIDYAMSSLGSSAMLHRMTVGLDL